MPTTISGSTGVTFPAGGTDNVAGAGVGTTDTQTLTNKTLTSPTLTTPVINSATVSTVNGTAPLAFCRAWVNFNGTGTVAIRASGNVSSITDNGAGNYSVNFATAMPDADYAPVISVEESGITCFCAFNNTVQQTAGVGRIGVFLGTGSSGYDAEQVNYVVLR